MAQDSTSFSRGNTAFDAKKAIIGKKENI